MATYKVVVTAQAIRVDDDGAETVFASPTPVLAQNLAYDDWVKVQGKVIKGMHEINLSLFSEGLKKAVAKGLMTEQGAAECFKSASQ